MNAHIKIYEAGKFEIGEAYMVPCVKVKRKWIPVIPILADDTDLGMTVQFKGKPAVEQRHWHIDVRFTSMFITLLSYRPNQTIEWKLRTCVRTSSMDAVTNSSIRQYLSGKLIEGNRDKVIKDGSIFRCPHKGTVLQDVEGHLICPNHSMVFNKNDGKLIPAERCVFHRTFPEGFKLMVYPR